MSNKKLSISEIKALKFKDHDYKIVTENDLFFSTKALWNHVMAIKKIFRNGLEKTFIGYYTMDMVYIDLTNKRRISISSKDVIFTEQSVPTEKELNKIGFTNNNGKLKWIGKKDLGFIKIIPQKRGI